MNELYFNLKKLRDSGRIDEAIELANNNRKIILNSADLLALVAHVYLLNEDDQKFCSYNDAGRKLEPNNKNILLNVARFMLKSNKIDEAIHTVNSIKNQTPDDVSETTAFLSTCLRRSNQIEEAKIQANKVIQVQPNNAEALLNLGIINVSEGNILEAFTQLRNVYVQRPNLYAIWAILSKLSLKLNQDDLALEICLKIIRRQPKNIEAITSCAAIYIRKEKYENAIDCLKSAIEINPTSAQLHNHCGIACYEFGRFEEAQTLFQKTLDLQPNNYDALNNLGVVLLDLQKPLQALKQFEKALQYKENTAEISNNIAKTKLFLGELDDAVEYYQKSLIIDPSNKQVLANVLTCLIQLPSESLRENQVELLQSLIAKAPESNSLEIVNLAAIWHWMRGNLDAALYYVERHNILWDTNYKSLNSQQQQFCAAYNGFIAKLLNFNEKQVLEADKSIYHIGDSHSLTFCNQVHIGNGKKFQIIPRLVIGGKAFHLSGDKHNSFKQYFIRHCSTIPRDSEVFVSLGEIDCRYEEGIIPAAKKMQIDCSEIVYETVSGYCNFLDLISKKYDLKISVLNIPAPSYVLALSKSQNEEVKQIRIKFNQALERELSQYKIKIIDIHRTSRESHGFVSEKYFLDGIHLRPEVLSDSICG